ncbi:hypothetical protein SAMN05192588_1027 [Nonlabens sp. Hel1_33_55]|nr:hypothetical protein SAMN05192588_1027 [Nonlabens sp. Hel1_33_55]
MGRSSTYYEELMKSRDTEAQISAQQLEESKKLISPLIKKAYSLEQAPAPTGLQKLYNNKGKSVPYYKSYYHPNHILHLYINLEQLEKHESNVQLILEERKPDVDLKEIPSLPMWESLIHLDLEKHRQLVKMASGQPWTLYKKTKQELVGNPIINQVMGYPQWIVNDIDYRKLENTTFLFQMELLDKERVLYFVFNSTSQNSEFYIQKW